MSPIDVSVVIPTRNGGPRFVQVAERVRAQRTPWSVELLAIDSQSTDGTDEVARKAGFRVLSIDPREFDHGATRDRAIAATSGRAIALLVQDALPLDESWLEKLAGPLLADAEAAGSFSRQLPVPGGNPILAARLAGWIAGQATSRRAKLDAERPWESLSPFQRLELCAFDNVASCVKREFWRRNPFGPRPFGEDLGWATWAIRSGFAIRFEADSVVEHSHDRGWRDEARRIYCDHRNLNRLYGMRTVPTLKVAIDGSRGARAQYLKLLDAANLPSEELARRKSWARRFALAESLAQWLAPIVNERGERGLLGWLDRRIRRGI
jgi:rhamnosyltransferase